jgi:hypothetical protein
VVAAIGIFNALSSLPLPVLSLSKPFFLGCKRLRNLNLTTYSTKMKNLHRRAIYFLFTYYEPPLHMEKF